MTGAGKSIRDYFENDPHMLARIDRIAAQVAALVAPSSATTEAARTLHTALDGLDERLVEGDLSGEEYERAYLDRVAQAAPDVILAAAQRNATLAAALRRTDPPADA
jgi:hypothetical protein